MKIPILFFLIFCSFVSINAGIFECNANSDCAFECKDNICICPPKQVHNLQGTKCLDLFYRGGPSCEDDNQCGLLGGSYKCNIGSCFCNEGWVYLKGKCIKRLKTGDICNENEDCFDGSDYNASICENKKCTCNVGYYNRQGFDCRKLRNLREYCSIDSDCIYSTCYFGTCDNRGYNGNLTRDDSGIPHASHSAHPPQPFNLKYAEDCLTSDSCTVKNMYCSPIFGKCLCKKGYFLFGNRCEAEIGSKCDDDNCNSYGKLCKEGICLCQDGRFLIPGAFGCGREVHLPSFECHDESDCALFGDHFQCIDIGHYKQCVCANGYQLNDNYLCEPCKAAKCNEGDCNIKNQICTSGSCICDNNAIYDTIEKACYSKLGGLCKTDHDCKKIENAVCGDENKCSCRTNFVKKSETQCLKDSSGIDSRHNEE